MARGISGSAHNSLSMSLGSMRWPRGFTCEPACPILSRRASAHEVFCLVGSAMLRRSLDQSSDTAPGLAVDMRDIEVIRAFFQSLLLATIMCNE